ncbi:MAG: toll/interleukin-1 receptor domain-containing protein [Proteobacteria bacterium]|nr:toll/interleukin-1 receptor domain-containing protein [Pseudomonadota bacterium]
MYIAHASEDKEPFVRELADALDNHVRVWYDDFTLTVGDSLREKMDEGLAKSRFGVVVLSRNFFSKHWPKQELNGLATRERDGQKVILPVWLDIDRDEVADSSPMLADRLAARAEDGLEKVVTDLLEAMDVEARVDVDEDPGDANESESPLAQAGEGPPNEAQAGDAYDSARPRFEVSQGGGGRLESIFAPRFDVGQFSGDPIADLQWRITGTRFTMEWRQAEGSSLDRTNFTNSFDLTYAPDEPIAETDELAFTVRFYWRGRWRTETHRWPMRRRELPNKVLWDFGDKLLPALVGDEEAG